MKRSLIIFILIVMALAIMIASEPGFAATDKVILKIEGMTCPA